MIFGNDCCVLFWAWAVQDAEKNDRDAEGKVDGCRQKLACASQRVAAGVKDTLARHHQDAHMPLRELRLV